MTPYLADADVTLFHGDVLDVLAQMPDETVDCVVCSPPYWGLRSYLADGHEDKPLELGLEETPDQYVTRLVEVFREVGRVLCAHGTCWVNLGDRAAGLEAPPPPTTVGWSDCGHQDWRPGVVLDPFVGSGTSCKVARDHGRHSVGIDLSSSYLELAAQRLQQQSLFSEPAA